MGLFDRFKKKEKEELFNDDSNYNINDVKEDESSTSALEDLNEQKIKESEEEKQKEELELTNNEMKVDNKIESQDDYNDLTTSPSIDGDRNISLEETKKFSGALSKEEFNNKYKKISDFKTALSLKEQMDLETNFSKDAMDIYVKLKNSLADSDKFRRELFFPYLLEKDQYACLDPKEREELSVLKESISEDGSLQRFVLGLAYYQVLGINDINDTSTFNKSLIDYYKLDDENIKITRERVINVADLIYSGVNEVDIEESNVSEFTK